MATEPQLFFNIIYTALCDYQIEGFDEKDAYRNKDC